MAGSRFRRSLRLKFAIVVSVFLAGVFTVTGVAMVRGNAQEVNDLLDQRGRMLATMQAEAVAVPLWNVDTPQVEAVLSALQRDPAFLGARIVAANGKTLSQVGEIREADALIFAEDVAKDGEKLGALELYLATTLLEDSLHRAEISTSFILGSVLASILIGLFVLLNFIFRPLGRIEAAVTSLSSGNLETAIPGAEREDEIGAIARAVAVFKQNAIDKLLVEREAEAAKVQAEEERRKAISTLADEFEANIGRTVGQFATASDQLADTAQSMSSLADRVTTRAGAAVQASEQAAGNVGTVAAAAEELSGSVQEINRQIAESTAVARNAVMEADAADATVRSLAEAAQRIGQVVNLIADIANQTNLLALNATIEAARAGDAGKGFAVVAHEVKMLANQSAGATEEIAQQIGMVQSETARAVDAIRNVGATISRMDGISSAIAAAVEQQGAATREIARSVEMVAQGSQEVSTNIAGVTEAAAHAGDASVTVLQAARKLSSESAQMRNTVRQFVASVRAG